MFIQNDTDCPETQGCIGQGTVLMVNRLTGSIAYRLLVISRVGMITLHLEGLKERIYDFLSSFTRANSADKDSALLSPSHYEPSGARIRA